jgi:hypothetical protein
MTLTPPPALDPRVPPGPLEDKWVSHKFNMMLVIPANKR